MLKITALGSAISLFVVTLPVAWAEEVDGDTHSLAQAAQNPVANMISLPFQNNTDFNFSPKDKTLNTLNIQPVIPFQVSDNWNVITRTIIPVVSQPGILPGDDRETGLGDSTITAFLSPNNDKICDCKGSILSTCNCSRNDRPFSPNKHRCNFPDELTRKRLQLSQKSLE